MATRLVVVDAESFKALLAAKLIRPASLQDVSGLHHKRMLCKHPNTGQYWVEVVQGVLK